MTIYVINGFTLLLLGCSNHIIYIVLINPGFDKVQKHAVTPREIHSTSTLCSSCVNISHSGGHSSGKLLLLSLQTILITELLVERSKLKENGYSCLLSKNAKKKFLGTKWKRKLYWYRKTSSKQKTLDCHIPRLKSNDCHLPNLPYLLFLSTFKNSFYCVPSRFICKCVKKFNWPYQMVPDLRRDPDIFRAAS